MKTKIWSCLVIPVLFAAACSSKLEEENKALREANAKLATEIAVAKPGAGLPVQANPTKQVPESRAAVQSAEKTLPEAKQTPAVTNTALEIKGEVFIVRRDGQTIKLSLVPVSIVDETELTQFRKSSLWLSKQKSELLEKHGMRQIELTGEISSIASLSAQIDKLEPSRSALAKTIEDTADSVKELKKELASYRGDRDFFAQSARIYREIDKVLDGSKEVGEEWREVAKKIESLQERLRGKKALIPKWQNEVAEGLQELESFDAAKFRLATSLIKGTQCITDGNGEFSLAAPKIENSFICATASRNTGTRTEHFFWLLPLLPEMVGKKIMLSSHNLLQEGGPNGSGAPAVQVPDVAK